MDEIEGDSFRISILPVNSAQFNEFKIQGTLDIRKVSADVEYGLIVGRSINPTIENGQKYILGTASSSVDFIRELKGLDTGSVYYVRAYGKGKFKSEYSANQIIGKVSPQILNADLTLNYGRDFAFTTNIAALNPKSSVKIFLNQTQVPVKSISGSNMGKAFITSFTNQLTPGEYTLSVIIDDLKLTYPKKLRLFEGTWQQVENMPLENGDNLRAADYFVGGDWIYTYGTGQGGFATSAVFTKYNYKTSEKVTLTPFDPTFRIDKAAILQAGTNIHFITGERTSPFQNASITKGHCVYQTTTDSWTNEAEFPGAERKNAVSVMANNKLYVGMGYKPMVINISAEIGYTDMYAYDLQSKLWKKVSDFPKREGRIFSGTFVIGDKLYITGGAVLPATLNGNTVGTKETWCYDTSTDQWSRKADYPGKGVISFNSFSIGAFGYVGMGESLSYDSYLGRNVDNHFFRYDPASNAWTEVSAPVQLISNPLSGSNGSAGLFGAGRTPESGSNTSLHIFTP